jgi:UDP-3-O-[3-hydroxymyristoyl] glucosamine N-acyltransferase
MVCNGLLKKINVMFRYFYIPDFQCFITNWDHHNNECFMVFQLDWLREIFPGCVSRAKETKIAKGCKLVGVTLGDHCNVGEKCRLTNVISLDHVKIEGNCELQNVIISSNAQIGDNAVLTDCLVGPKYQVPSGGL